MQFPKIVFLFLFSVPFSAGREPSISSDTRTDSSTDSYSYMHSHSHHESMASHFSSDSQGTVICNPDNNDAASHSSAEAHQLTCKHCGDGEHSLSHRTMLTSYDLRALLLPVILT